ncbi:MAG: GNAT family N-acetyltransferase [Sphingomonas sp.]|nr:GNAT family N-acetyltransferase [Sphingomonas sp.]
MRVTEQSDQQDNWAAELFTQSGLAVSIRPVAPADRPLVEDFFGHIGADDLRFRFLTTIRRVDQERINELCIVDVPRMITFLAFHAGLLVAIATVAGDPEAGKAEVAMATRPEWKHRGVSWTLLEHAIRFARGCGYSEILSVEKADNEGALQVERDMGFNLSLAGGDASELVATKIIPKG